MQQIGVTDLKDHIDSSATVTFLLDVREPWEYQLCHIDNSRLIPMSQVANAIEELDKEEEIFVICHHGIRSQRVGLLLKDSGFQKVVNVSGGIDAWAQSVDPAMATY